MTSLTIIFSVVAVSVFSKTFENPLSSTFFSKNFLEILLKKLTIQLSEGLNNKITAVVAKKKINTPVPI